MWLHLHKSGKHWALTKPDSAVDFQTLSDCIKRCKVQVALETPDSRQKKREYWRTQEAANRSSSGGGGKRKKKSGGDSCGGHGEGGGSHGGHSEVSAPAAPASASAVASVSAPLSTAIVTQVQGHMQMRGELAEKSPGQLQEMQSAVMPAHTSTSIVRPEVSGREEVLDLARRSLI
jgi:hypothetical protein